MKKERIREAIAFVFVVLALSIGLPWAIAYGEWRNESVECSTWQQQARDFPGFYLLQWQRDQCDAHKIWIAAPVKAD